MSHVYHQGLPNTPAGTILWDGCEECENDAQNINQLDRGQIAWLIEACNKGRFPGLPTNAERKAESNVWHALLMLERFTGRNWREVIGLVADAH